MEQSLVFCATVTRDYFSGGKPTARFTFCFGILWLKIHPESLWIIGKSKEHKILNMINNNNPM